jgi:hypothetical protein
MHRILRNGHFFRFHRVSNTRVLCAVGLMWKKQATSAEDPEQEDEDAAGFTSIEEIGA